ncbi:uncharacterized protein LOC129574273 isoform X2 [Sitodiplosis mosellana]|uniref:uncharacterized protein LOC129574273 isoform X2 n=1 Tax=Sitodiplosis mosellana TaxID=263140 RepID=UPI00244467FD|nr:uncharacterized protein LOC129574273 isoform X2 [Sitodiplosis mosellana]
MKIPTLPQVLFDEFPSDDSTKVCIFTQPQHPVPDLSKSVGKMLLFCTEVTFFFIASFSKKLPLELFRLLPEPNQWMKFEKSTIDGLDTPFAIACLPTESVSGSVMLLILKLDKPDELIMYTGAFKDCRTVLLSDMLLKYKRKIHDIYIDNTMAGSWHFDIDEDNRACDDIREIIEKYPDYIIHLQTGVFDSLDLLVNLARRHRLNVKLSELQQTFFYRTQYKNLFELDAKLFISHGKNINANFQFKDRPKVYVRSAKTFDSDTYKRLFEEKKIINIRLTPSTQRTYTNFDGLFFVEYSSHASAYLLSEIFDIVKPKRVHPMIVEDELNGNFCSTIPDSILNDGCKIVHRSESEEVATISNAPVNVLPVAETSNNVNCSADELQFEMAWEVPGEAELQVLSSLKSSLSIESSQNELDRALQYFQHRIKDFPGEFFLQSKFVFMDLLQLLECRMKGFDQTSTLTCCLKLTQNLARRITMRSDSTLYVAKRKHTTKQYKIGSYCFKIFDAVLKLLRKMYTDPNLAGVNECFQNLFEIVDLIVKTAGSYSPEVAVEYHFDEIISRLAVFLGFIRKMTANYSRMGSNTHRNDSISIIFLLCQLLIFKETRNNIEKGTIPMLPIHNESTLDLDVSQRIRRFSLKNARKLLYDFDHDTVSNVTLDNHTASESKITGNYITEMDTIDVMCRRELEIALLDFPLKHFYPEVEELIVYALKIDNFPDKSPIKILMNLTELLQPIVTLLKDPKMCTYEKVLSHGIKSLDVLTVTKSNDLTHLLFKAITNLTPQYNANDQMREDAERLLLHMLSYGCVEMKRLVYELASEKMSYSFGCIMEGKRNVPKSYTSTTFQSCLFGVPMSAEILAEILCNGSSSDDTKTAAYAENILTLILRTKTLIPTRWKDVCKFLTPVLPLILCHAKTTTQFGQLILSLGELDKENDLPTVILIKSSVALLFSRDTHTQSEALYRLMYLIQNVPNAEIYMPNLNCITDTIPGSLCIVEPLPYSDNDDFCDLYEVRLIDDLLEVLQNPNTEPSSRHSTLTQLNIVVEDPVALNHFHEVGGDSIILKVLERSLRENSTSHYAYNAIQIVGILTKMCLRISTFRRRLADDIQAYVLILRSLLLFHTNDKFRRECVVLLFSMAFSEYIVGGNKKLIIPPVCKKLYLPITCELSWKSTQEQNSLLEIILANEKLTDTNSNHSDTSSKHSADGHILKNLHLQQYIRLTFNALWFESLDKLIDCPNFVEGSRNVELNYKKNPDSLSFDRALCATSADLDIVKGTSQKYRLSQCVEQIKDTTSFSQFAASCAAIENFSNVDSTGHQKQWDSQQFLQSFAQFCTVEPKSERDKTFFLKYCRLLCNLIERDFIDVHIWVLQKFNQKQCIYFDLMNNPKVSTGIFLCNIRLMETILSKTIDLQSKKIIEQLIFHTFNDDQATTANKAKPASNLFEHIFEMATRRIDTLLEEKKIDKLQCLMSLLRLLASSGKVLVSKDTASDVSNKLFQLMSSLSSFSYVGSKFNKDCLFTIINMMNCTHEFPIKKRFVGFLYSLCGHVDFEIRTNAWNILLKMSYGFDEAKTLVQEIDTLPGDLYARCLNTLLDDTESAIVRENPALLFASLISYRNANNEIHEDLYPKSANGMGCKWIGQLIYHHDLIKKIRTSVEYMHVDDVIELKRMANIDKIVTCNQMRTYCKILSNLLPLKGAGDVDSIYQTTHEISKAIPRIRQSTNQSSVQLLTEICSLISLCFVYKKSFVEVIAREFQSIQSLISFLNVDLLESISKSIKHAFWPEVLKVLRQIAGSPIGFSIICESLSEEPKFFDGIATLCIYGLSDRDINVSIMRFISDLMIASQASNYNHATFGDLLNETPASASVKEATLKFIFNTDIISQSVVDWAESMDSDKIYMAEILFGQLSNLFERFVDNPQIEEIPMEKRDTCFMWNCKSLETLLKCSERARMIATRERFLLLIVEQMGKIRRNDNPKAEKRIIKLKLLFNVVRFLYSSDCLQDDELIQPIIGVCYEFWPMVEAGLQSVFMKMLLFISNNSLPVCKALSVAPPVSVAPHAFLQSIVEYCVTETGKPKTAQANMETLELALKIVTNCCCCVEGRVLIGRTRMLSTLSRLHPQVAENQRPWPQLTQYWLKLFEVLTRHNDSNKETHMNLLCNLAESSNKPNRCLALKILRNMSFNPENRAALLQSSDFQHIMYNVLDKKVVGDEQLLITVSIWKLTANNAEAKNIMKNSPILSKLRALDEIVCRHQSENLMRTTLNTNDEASSSGEKTLVDLAVALKEVLKALNI